MLGNVGRYLIYLFIVFQVIILNTEIAFGGKCASKKMIISKTPIFIRGLVDNLKEKLNSGSTTISFDVIVLYAYKGVVNKEVLKFKYIRPIHFRTIKPRYRVYTNSQVYIFGINKIDKKGNADFVGYRGCPHRDFVEEDMTGLILKKNADQLQIFKKECSYHGGMSSK